MSKDLKLEYRILSELSDYFPKNSSHKAARAIGTRMQQIIDELEKPVEEPVDCKPMATAKVFHPMPVVLHDQDGYPTQEALDYLQNWWLGYHGEVWLQGEFSELNKNNITSLLKYMKRLWHFDDWGFIVNEAEKKLELHTGGWSGNEEVLSYFKNTAFAQFYWKMSKAGGHYYYEWN
jgi:hypothetical protein